MKQMIRRGAGLLLVALFLVSGCLIAKHQMDSAAAENAGQQAQTLAGAAIGDEVLEELPEPSVPLAELPEVPQQALPDEVMQCLTGLELDALQTINAEVLGWICIPDTVISYPLLQTSDNETYLTKAWNGVYNSSGSIFLECKSSPDFQDFNTIIYGHRMNDGSMFGGLRKYEDPDYLEAHPYIYIVTEQDVRRYQVFSAYEAPVRSNTYRLYIEEEQTKQEALTHFINSSVLKSDVVPTTEDKILTLSTCTGKGNYNFRWVVQAVLIDCCAREQ